MHDQAIRPHEPSPADDIRKMIADLGYHADWQWAWDNYKPTLLELSRVRGLVRHLEIGAGRDPLFQPDEAAKLGLHISLNDISAHELSLAPSGYNKVECDITSPQAVDILGSGTYDLAYSRMVMEHVPDVAAMWRNINATLAPGGIALSFFPTLYAFPFALNNLMPKRMSRFIMESLFPERRPDGHEPVFPTHYDHCFSSESKLMPMLRQAGFADAIILPFWGHAYFWRFPGIKQIDAAFNRMAEQRHWRNLSSYAYVIAIK